MIREYKPKDYNAILKLHCDTFLGISGEETYEKKLHGLKSCLDLQQALVSEVDRKEDEKTSLLGFVVYSYLINDSFSKVNIEKGLSAGNIKNRSQQNVDNIKSWFKERSGQAQLGFFQHNEFTTRDVSVNYSDWYVNSLAVHQNHRGQGHGTDLLEHLVKMAEAKNLNGLSEGEKITAIYAHQYGHQKSLNPFSKVGFRPIIFWGPLYNDNSPGTLMGKKIK